MFSSTTNPAIQFENALSEAILQETSQNPAMKEHLQGVADNFKRHILDPIKADVRDKKALADIPQPSRDLIIKLAEMHSDKERQYGGLLRLKYKTDTDITSNMNNIHELLLSLENAISNINERADNPLKVAQAVKVLVDLAFGFVEKIKIPQNPKDPVFEAIRLQLWPTPEEMNVRILATEIGKKAQIGRGLGLSRDDLIDAKLADEKDTLYGSGKAAFADVDMLKRLSITVKNFNDKIKNLSEGKETPEKTNKDISDFLATEQNKYGNAWVDMLLNLNKDPRGPLAAYEALSPAEQAKIAKQFEPAFIKLAKNTNSMLIATISGSTARVFMTAAYFNSLENGSKLDLNKTQFLANAIAGLFIKGGHHSVFEVAESYNRLIDLYALTRPDNLPAGSRESTLPYYRPGDTFSFIHSDIREAVKESVRQSGAPVPIADNQFRPMM